MSRFWVVLKLHMLAILLAAGYGVLHDQVSYSLSPEYYTRFKFIQFHTGWAFQSPRLGAAFIGALATWWMGLIIALVLYVFSKKNVPPAQLFRNNVRSFFEVFTVTLMVTAGGLALAYARVDAGTIEPYRLWLRPGVTDAVQFIRVGFMHNASYLGGIAGLCVALCLRWFRYCLTRRSQRNSLS
ncbi:MAG TPA: hypothetical protein VFM46_05140 [Pseudomonadales bacterium]|nr:hypothetical protein [Pseudomonadales bacterium]